MITAAWRTAVCAGFLLTGCGVLRDTVDDNFKEGTYRSHSFATNRVYVQNRADTLVAYNLKRVGINSVADTLHPALFPVITNLMLGSRVFNTPSLDFDGLTIPFKYRFNTASLPQQFTTSLNGAIYLGLRNDRYKLLYKKHFFNYFQREIRHYAISAGGFTGFGSTAMNPWVTNNAINVEYEGVVWLKGAAVIMAIGKFTSGVSVGWDHLLDNNKSYWIYQGKPWLGLLFGLNLN